MHGARARGISLEQQISAQLAAEFLLAGLYEDINPTQVLARHMPTFIATRARKLTG